MREGVLIECLAQRKIRQLDENTAQFVQNVDVMRILFQDPEVTATCLKGEIEKSDKSRESELTGKTYDV